MASGTILENTPGKKVLLLGNQGFARGALEAGVQVATGYPGTPSSEILEALAGTAKAAGIYVEWSVNEKVAFEVAYAASLAGVRAMVTLDSRLLWKSIMAVRSRSVKISPFKTRKVSSKKFSAFFTAPAVPSGVSSKI